MGFYQRRSGLSAAYGLLALGGLASAAMPACHAADTGALAMSKGIDLDVAGGNLHVVVSMLERQANVEALVQDGDKPFKPVFVHLDGASLPKALRTIAQSAGAKVSKNDDGVYVFEPQSAPSDGSDTSNSFAPAVQAPAAAPPVDTRPEARYPSGSLHWQTITLQHAVPLEILKIMHWEQDSVELDPLKPLQMPIMRPNITSTQPNIPNTYPNFPNSGYYNNGNGNNGYANNGYGGGDASVPIGTGNGGPAGANYSAHRSVDPNSNSQANQFPGFGGGGNPFGGGGGNPFGGGGGNPFGGGGGNNPFQPQPFQPNGGAGGNGAQGRGAALPEGVNKIYALQSNNSLLVQATPDGYNLVKQLVKILDIAPRQVEIKVEFVTASVTDVDNLGVNFDLVPYPGLELATSQGSGQYGGTATGIGPTFLQYATGNIVAQLFQTLVRTRGKVVQAPLVTTTNNYPATINISTTVPFITTTVVGNGGLNGGTTQGSNVNFLPITSGLVIQPRINSDDSVTMNLAPQIQDVTGQVVGGVPTTITQSLTTLRTVRSGDTMVLGGLVRKQETSSSQRIPILSDIPILGGLFRTRNKQVNDQELLIFVTPTIIGESNDSNTANANGGQSVTVTP
jgi:general secretion pathway protein D